jgi:chaperone required for assembly of F1-ATPase
MKRFYKDATVDVDDTDGGFVVLLDGRSIKTPAKNRLKLPTRAVGDAVASEWQAQGEEIDPATMPMMRFGATAIDRVTTQRKEVISEISAFGGHDLLCYRGEEPELLKLQETEWQPVLNWAASELNVPLATTLGITSVDQDPVVLGLLSDMVSGFSDMELSAVHTMVSITGSLILVLALIHGKTTVDDVWRACTIDEKFQEKRWGRDAEAEERLATRQSALEDAWKFFGLCHEDTNPQT